MILYQKRLLALFFLFLSSWGFSAEKAENPYSYLASLASLYLPEEVSRESIRYERVRTLGRGAFGYVVLFQSEGRPDLALKLPSDREVYESRLLEKEASKARAFDQLIKEEKELSGFDARKYFVRFLFFYEQAAQKAIVYEFIPGETLGAYSRRNKGSLSLSRIQPIAYQLLTALSFLQKFRMVHFDLKPDNIMRTPSGRVIIIDLGSLHQMKERYPLGERDYKVTRYYRSPENVFGLPDQGKNDIWSLGCILAELYLGEALFEARVGEYELPSLWVGVLGRFPGSFKRRLVVVEKRQGIAQKRYQPSLFFIEREVRFSEENYLLENPCGIDPNFRQQIFREKMTRPQEASSSHEEVRELEGFHQVLWDALQYLPFDRKTAENLLQNPWFDGYEEHDLEPEQEEEELKELESDLEDLDPEQEGADRPSKCCCLKSLWRRCFPCQSKNKSLLGKI